MEDADEDAMMTTPNSLLRWLSIAVLLGVAGASTLCRAGTTSPARTAHWYDPAGCVSEASAGGGVEQMDFPNGVSTNYVYVAGDLRNRVDRLTTASASSVLLDLDYDYDPASTRRITAIEDVEGARRVLASGGTLPTNVVPGWSYGYDAVGRLTGAVFVGVGDVDVDGVIQALPPETWGYAYDTARRRAAATYSAQDGSRNDAYARDSTPQQGRLEVQGQEFRQAELAHGVAFGGQDDLEVGGKLRQRLTAHAAGGHQQGGVPHDGQGHEAASARGDGGGHGGALGADRRRVRGVLDVGALHDGAVVAEQRSPHGEARVRAVRARAGLAGRADQQVAGRSVHGESLTTPAPLSNSEA